jgi:hypothetical protein
LRDSSMGPMKAHVWSQTIVSKDVYDFKAV